MQLVHFARVEIKKNSKDPFILKITIIVVAVKKGELEPKPKR